MIALALLLQIAVPPPRGFVNDFARTLDSQSIRHMEAVITEVRARTRGEIAVVTLPDIGDRSASEVALQIGRAWGVGARAEAGDPAKNLGVVVLLVPRNREPGSGQIFIATGRGAEGFLTDARAGRIRDAMIPFLAREEYGKGLSVGVDLIAQAFATEFGVTLSSPEYVRPPAAAQPRQPNPGLIVLAIVMILLISALSRMGRRGRRRRRWGGWWWGGGLGGGGGGWGGLGGGGGGFGGFGGGGGFSGGGAGGRF